MSNKFEIFVDQTSDAESPAFKISRPDSVGLSDTEYSAYFEIFLGAGNIGGGSVLLKKKCQDGAFRQLVTDSKDLNTKIAGLDTTSKGEVIALNFKADDEFKMELIGSTGPNLTITGTNMKAA